MAVEDEFEIRPGRVQSRHGLRAKPFITQILIAVQKAGGRVSRSGRITSGRGSRFGRGKRATVQANRLITRRSRGAVIKARVVRHNRCAAPLALHLSYLQREGVTRDGEKAQIFGPTTDDADADAFARRCDGDRHHFRFIVSPEDAPEMADLKAFTRELAAQMQKDLGTKLDWVAACHWNTAHPHIHLIVRGVADDGQNLVIARDYIKEGMRARAEDLITLELGPRTDQEIHLSLKRQVEAERWTQLDRQLMRDIDGFGLIDLAPRPDKQPDEYHVYKVGRMRKLESLGLAYPLGPGQWALKETAEITLRQLGERNDIIKRIHRGLTERGVERAMSSYVLAGESIDQPVIGRLIARGLDDELKGTAYAVIDGVDGRTHHVRLPTLEAAGDGEPGAIVELRKFDDARGRCRAALAVRSDLALERQVTANGATWLDRQAIARDPIPLSDGGFGFEVKAALRQRIDHLVEQGFAQRDASGVRYRRDLIDTLRQRELAALGERLAAKTSRPFNRAAAGDYVAGTYRQRFLLASGRFAMIDDGFGFQLVPWTPSIEQQLGRHINGIARGDGGVNWEFGRKRGLGIGM